MTPPRISSTNSAALRVSTAENVVAQSQAVERPRARLDVLLRTHA